MKGKKLREYEGLFLVDEARASESFQEVIDHIRGLIERRGAQIKKLEKWNSMRLAYEVQGKKRGTYFIAHFTMNPAEVAALNHDCGISPIVMRAMVLRMENVGVVLIETEEPRRERSAPVAAEAEGETVDVDILGNADELEEN